MLCLPPVQLAPPEVAWGWSLNFKMSLSWSVPEEVMKKFLVLALMLTALAGGLSACNTIQGAGQDIKDGGAALDRAIR